MKNLAKDTDCDRYIERELTRAGIEIVRGERMNAEVPASITGKLGDLTFKRGWYYWMVSGNVPLEIARELYADPVGSTDIRVDGHCVSPSPDGRECWVDEDGFTLIPMTQETSFTDEKINELGFRRVNNPSAVGMAVVKSYHIDTEVGLRLFADTLKGNNLVPVAL